MVTYSENEELGSKRLGLFLFFDIGRIPLGECFLGSTMRGDGGRTVLGDGFREDCFDISSFFSGLDVELLNQILIIIFLSHGNDRFGMR